MLMFINIAIIVALVWMIGAVAFDAFTYRGREKQAKILQQGLPRWARPEGVARYSEA